MTGDSHSHSVFIERTIGHTPAFGGKTDAGDHRHVVLFCASDFALMARARRADADEATCYENDELRLPAAVATRESPLALRAPRSSRR